MSKSDCGSFSKTFASDVFESYSAGTVIKTQINQSAARLMKQLYDIDMEKGQYSKLISDIPVPDITTFMGCDVSCPYIGKSYDDNWGLIDPTGQNDEMYKMVIAQIEKRYCN